MSNHRRSRRTFVPRIATHIGALVLLALCPAAVGAAGAEAEAGIAVQEVLPKLSLPAEPAKPASAGDLSLEARVGRIEAIIPHLATKEDLRDAKAEMKADLQATEAKLEAAIETKLEIAIANLRTEIGEKLQEQMQNYVLINAGMVTMLGALLLAVMKFMLLPASLEGPVRTAMRQLKKEERRAARAKSGDDEQEGADHP